MGWLALAGTLVSAGMQADAAARAAKAQKEAADYQAAVARQNQLIGEENAKYAIEKGTTQAEVQKMKIGQMSATARAALGASGVRLNEGSPLNVQGDIAGVGALDVETIRHNAIKEAYGYRLQGAGFGQQAALFSMQSGYATTAGRVNQYSSLASGAASFGDKWSRYQATGVET